MFISEAGFAKLDIIGVYMYNRGLRRYKRHRNPRNNPRSNYRRNMTISKFTSFEDRENIHSAVKFTSIPEARAFLLSHYEICKNHFSPNFREAASNDPYLLESIDNAARLVKKGDRRNYRRQVKAAILKLYDHLNYISEDGGILPMADDPETLKSALGSLSEGIKNSLEVESNEAKAIKKVIGYVRNTELGFKVAQGERAPTVGILPKLEHIIKILFAKRAVEVKAKPTQLMQSGANQVDYSSDVHAPLPQYAKQIEDIFEEAVETSGGQMDLGGNSPWASPPKRALPPKDNGHHHWERVCDTKGNILSFRIYRHSKKKTIRKVSYEASPKYENGDIILDMSQGARALRLVVDDNHRVIDELVIPMTDDMHARYQGTYLFVVRQLAADGDHKKFLSAIDDRKKGRYRYKKNPKKTRKMRKR